MGKTTIHAVGNFMNAGMEIAKDLVKDNGSLKVRVKQETIGFEVYYKDLSVASLTDLLEEGKTTKDIKSAVITDVEEGEKSCTFTLEIEWKEDVRSKDFSKEIEEVSKEKIDAGIISKEDLDRNIEVMRNNHVSEKLIYEAIKRYEKQEVPVRVPKTFYREMDKDSRNFSNLVASSLCGQANILKGEKSTGKNACAETLAMVLNLPYYCIGLNSQTYDEEMTGTKNTDNSDADLITLELAEAYLIYNNPVVFEAFSQDLKDEIQKKATKYQAIKDKCASVRIVYETTPYINWLENGGVLCINEINMGAPNFLQKFLNSILDNTGFIEIAGYGRVNVHKNCVLIGTENENYIGTNRMNEATLSRFGSLIFENPEDITDIIKAGVEDYVDIEEREYKMCNLFFNQMKKIAEQTGDFEAVSIRGLIAAINQYAMSGEDLKGCVEQHIVNHCNDRNSIYSVLDEVFE